MKTRCGKDCPNVKMTQEETLQHNPKGWEMVEVSPGCFVSALHKDVFPSNKIRTQRKGDK